MLFATTSTNLLLLRSLRKLLLVIYIKFNASEATKTQSLDWIIVKLPELFIQLGHINIHYGLFVHLRLPMWFHKNKYIYIYKWLHEAK